MEFDNEQLSVWTRTSVIIILYAFSPNGSGARYRSAIVVVVIHRVWQQAAEPVREHGILYGVWKDEEALTQDRSQNLAFPGKWSGILRGWAVWNK